MAPLILGLGVPELLIILAVVLLLFGGSRLAGLGKSSGRALREFKEETKGLKGGDPAAATGQPPVLGPEPGATPPGTTTGTTLPNSGTVPNGTDGDVRKDL